MITKKPQPKTTGTKARLVIVDDHPIVRQGLMMLIDHEKDLAVCAQAQDSYEAIKAVKATAPDLAIVDISLREDNGVELIKDIKVQHPEVPVLALSMHDESLYAERVLRAGAKGYIMKQQAPEKVISAIRKVLGGEIYLSEKMAAKMVLKLVGGNTEVGDSPVDRLSDRELEVFLLIGRGHGTRKISERLHLSIKTIETYRSHIKEKLNLNGATELLQYAIQWVNSCDRT